MKGESDYKCGALQLLCPQSVISTLSVLHILCTGLAICEGSTAAHMFLTMSWMFSPVRQVWIQLITLRSGLKGCLVLQGIPPCFFSSPVM